MRGLLIVPDSGWMVTCCSSDRTVRVWDYTSGEELRVWSHPEKFKCIALKRTTGHIVAGTEEHHLISFPLSDVDDAIKARQGESEYAAGELAPSPDSYPTPYLLPPPSPPISCLPCR